MIKLDEDEKRIVKKHKGCLERNEVVEFFEAIFDDVVSECQDGYVACESVSKVRQWLEEHNIDVLKLCSGKIPVGMFFASDIQNATIPEGIEYIDDYAFSECFHLKSVKLPSTLKVIGDKAFSACESLPSLIIPEGVQAIWVGCFSECTNLKEVYLPSTITMIEREAFHYCPTDLKIYCKGDPKKINWAERNDYNIEEI